MPARSPARIVASEGQMHLDRRLLGWGLFFILLGGVPLAVREGWLPADVISRWPSLWPLILIGLGLALLLSRSRAALIGTLIVAVTLGLIGGSLIGTGVSGLSFGSCGSGTSTPFAGQ